MVLQILAVAVAVAVTAMVGFLELLAMEALGS
jgi:hypothetical protein